MVPSTVDWSGEPPGRLASVVRYLGASLPVAIGVFLAFVLVTMVLGGASRYVLFFAVVLVVGGPFSLLYLWYALRYGEDSEKRALREHLPDLRLRWLVLATPFGALLLYTVALVPWLFVVYALVGVFGWTVATTGRTGGTLDVETGVLTREHDERDVEHDLSGLESFRSLRLGPYVVCWLRHTRRNVLDEPFGVVFPADAFDEIRPALVQLTERNTSERPKPTAERAILVGFGLLFLAVAVGFVVAGPPRANVAAWLVAAWGLLFVLLAWVA